MSEVVIDTNVLLVANRTHDDISPECVIACAEMLSQIQADRTKKIVIDNGWKILGEYLNKTRPNQPKGVGDEFLKWLLQNITLRVDQVTLNETAENYFDEFPAPELQDSFDPPDRKFVAVSNAHPSKPPVLQAADCKWLDWWPDLKNAGVEVDFLCPDDVQRFYQKKFPNSCIPVLPE